MKIKKNKSKFNEFSIHEVTLGKLLCIKEACKRYFDQTGNPLAEEVQKILDFFINKPENKI